MNTKVLASSSIVCDNVNAVVEPLPVKLFWFKDEVLTAFIWTTSIAVPFGGAVENVNVLPEVE